MLRWIRDCQALQAHQVQRKQQRTFIFQLPNELFLLDMQMCVCVRTRAQGVCHAWVVAGPRRHRLVRIGRLLLDWYIL
jgi:hypothetical protein